MSETEAEERNIISDSNNMTMDTVCQSPVTTNKQGENANAILTSERLKNSDALAEMLKGLTVNDAGYYNSDKNYAEKDPKRDPKVATHASDEKRRKVTDTDTTKGNSPQNILINRTLLIITMPIDPRIPDGVAACIGTPHACQMPNSKVVITDAACISARVSGLLGT